MFDKPSAVVAVVNAFLPLFFTAKKYMMIWNTISCIPVIGLLLLCVATIATHDMYLFVTTMGALVVVVLVAVIKALSIPYMMTYPWLQRPKDGMGCDCLDIKGSDDAKPGFPSGHAALVTFMVVMLIWKYARTDTLPSWIAGGALLIAAVGVSRMRLRCHTYMQVWVGQLLGIFAACCLMYLA
jgi:membrane-associated phospholipid phosphatase